LGKNSNIAFFGELIYNIINMNTIQTVKNIQDKFNINAIYARMVFDVVKSDDIEMISRVIDEKPKPFIK
jgi:hypothetical protein